MPGGSNPFELEDEEDEEVYSFESDDDDYDDYDDSSSFDEEEEFLTPNGRRHNNSNGYGEYNGHKRQKEEGGGNMFWFLLILVCAGLLAVLVVRDTSHSTSEHVYTGQPRPGDEVGGNRIPYYSPTQQQQQHGEHKSGPKIIHLLGERNSGTTYMEDVLRKAYFPRYVQKVTRGNNYHPFAGCPSRQNNHHRRMTTTSGGTKSTTKKTTTGGTKSTTKKTTTGGTKSTTKKTTTGGTKSTTKKTTSGTKSTTPTKTTSGTKSTTKKITTGTKSTTKKTTTGTKSTTKKTTTGTKSTTKKTTTGTKSTTKKTTTGTKSTTKKTTTGTKSTPAKTTTGTKSTTTSKSTGSKSTPTKKTTGTKSTTTKKKTGTNSTATTKHTKTTQKTHGNTTNSTTVTPPQKGKHNNNNCIPVFNFKHMFRHSPLTETEITTLKSDNETLWVLMVRNPCDWADGMFRKPWHMCPPDDPMRCPGPYIGLNASVLSNVTRESFFTMPWNDWHESSFGEYQYENVFALRAHKLRLMKQLLDAVPHQVKIVHLQDLERNPERVVQDMKLEFNLQLKDSYRTQTPSKTIHHEPLCLSQEEWKIAEQEIDWELEGHFGFHHLDCHTCYNR